jgi:hypothetical protein
MRLRTRTMLLAAVAAAAVNAASAGADVTSDRPAAILIFPRIVAARSISNGAAVQLVTDTLVQISNTSTEPTTLHCFNVNATGYCSNSGFACDSSGDATCPDPRDLCVPQWTETDFDVVLTPRQPLAWRASTGLKRADLPLDGRALSGPNGESNAGTLVPPVRLKATASELREFSIYRGELKCIVVDDQGHGAARNVVKGEATVVSTFSEAPFDESSLSEIAASRYNAVGIEAIDGDANGDDVLELGGDANEYRGCPNVLIAQHFFDFAPVEALPVSIVFSELTLVPCTENFRAQEPGATTAQFLVFNEFEQRFSTSARVDCLFYRPLSNIDTRQATNSIFSVEVAGTIAGQTRIRGVSGGLLGIVTEGYSDAPSNLAFLSGDDAYNLGIQGERDTADRVTVPQW